MESLEEMQSRQRKEQKDLQARVTQKKKSATKKTRKGVNDECAELERQLKERHEKERATGATMNGNNEPNGDAGSDNEDSTDEPTPQSTNDTDDVSAALASTTISEPPSSENGQPKKRNRAKERLARRAAEQEAAVEDAKKEAANQPNPKATERAIMLKEMKANGLIEKSIRPDGHCLFSAVADQLSQLGIPLDVDANEELKEYHRYKEVRKAAARYIEGHPDEFVAWLDEPLDKYVEKIRETPEWGGHLELLALAKTYNVKICVLQEGGSQTIEPGLENASEPEKIWLAYYRHGFGLGEHYNSLRKAP